MHMGWFTTTQTRSPAQPNKNDAQRLFCGVFSQVVGKASVFISHPWHMPAGEFFEALCQPGVLSDSDYCWIDLYSHNQFGSSEPSSKPLPSGSPSGSPSLSSLSLAEGTGGGGAGDGGGGGVSSSSSSEYWIGQFAFPLGPYPPPSPPPSARA
jgi:hypothetical protein